MIALAARLPVVTRAPKAQTIEVDVRTPLPPEPPPPEPPPPPPPKEPEPKAVAPKVAMRERPTLQEPPPKREDEPEPPKAEPPQQEQTEAPRRIGPVDLTLHNLPTVPGGDGITVPGGSGGTFGTPAPRKEWRPKGDAGDPILGKIQEKPVDEFPLENQGRDGYVYKGPQFKARINLDGTVTFNDKTIRDFNGTSGSFDVTDLFMKGKKQDPYRYEKEKFLAATAAKRAELQRRFRAEQLEASLAMLPRNLERIWNDPRKSAHARRDAIYKLWRDIETGDDLSNEAGNEARKIIITFIRKRLPLGSEDAFTDEELAAYNRSGKLAFRPYDD